MDASRRLGLLAALAICALAFAACAARSVYSYVPRGADLSVYTRYSWGPADRTGTGDPRLDNNQIFQERVQSAVEKQLAARGFEKTATESSDLLVHYHASVRQRIDLRDAEPSQPCPECKPFIYDAGTLVIDLVDVRAKTLVWRGWAEGNVEGVVDDQRWMEDRIDDAVMRIFERLPAGARHSSARP